MPSRSDIKPENLLFYPVPFIPTKNPKPKGPEDEDKADEGEFIPGVGAGGIGTIKIADFGLSKVIWDSQTMTPCGTVGYTAPEIVKDERYSKSVDMWALGCVLYTLLCGFPPFYDESIQVLTEKVARGQYTFLSPWWDDISKGAQDLVSHLLTVDPEKRYTIEEFLNHPWIKQTNEVTTAAADAPPLATPLYQRQREYGFNQGLQPGGPRQNLSLHSFWRLRVAVNGAWTSGLLVLSTFGRSSTSAMLYTAKKRKGSVARTSSKATVAPPA